MEADQQAKGSLGRRQQGLVVAWRSGHDIHTPGLSGLLNTHGLDTFSTLEKSQQSFSLVKWPRATVLRSAFSHV